MGMGLQAHFIKTGRLLRNQGANYIVVREGTKVNLIRLHHGVQAAVVWHQCDPLAVSQTPLATAARSTQPGLASANQQQPTVAREKPARKKRPLSRIVLGFGTSNLVSSGLL